ncbi:MAG: alpha/beta hydrolase [Pelagibacterium sp. SCN 64-44]|nr:MAG: alpha/beta hydrolase [Pelagibacterium sp. SCN 64-44]
MTELQLWYREPAIEWTDALPIGNGRLGAMVFGGVGREELQLNESTLWSGGPYQPTNPEALPNLAAVRELIFAGRYAEAHELAQRHLLAQPPMQMSYQPAGNLFLDFRHEAAPGSYRRSLDLDSAVVTTRYDLLGTGIDPDAARFTRTAFTSAADDVMAMRLTTTLPGSLAFELWLDSPQEGDLLAENASTLSFRGRNFGKHGIEGRLTFGIDVRVDLQGGSIERRGRRLIIRDADRADIFVDMATSFVRFDDVSGDPEARLAERRARLAGISYEDLLARHVAGYRAQFRRMALDLGPSRSDLPTDQRIVNFGADDDPGLVALYVQYGRYLMIASSQPGSQAATLQGIWNKDTRPPWGSKYTANINLQMNYWLPDPANLPEMVDPLIAMAEDLAITGAEMARQHYGARGWVMHHNTDLWRATGPVDGAYWGIWPTGGAWLMAQLWDHARFQGRPIELVQRLYGPLRGATLFALDTLVNIPGTDYLATVPSLSPENRHPHGASLCAGPTMDNQILRDLFGAFVAAAEQLGEDDEMVAAARAARQRLPEHRIGRAGQLQEWMDDWDMDVPELNHRHVSHLYGLYPSDQIRVDTTPDLAQAARRSLEIRGDEATGWGIGWRINLWARLRDGDRANAVLGLLLSPARSYRNLFDAHPPFQIDGNFGGAAGVLEMLVQSSEEAVWLLPALPSGWRRGEIRGVRARGGIELDFSWSEGEVQRVQVRSDRARRLTIHAGKTIIIDTSADSPVEVDFRQAEPARRQPA